ncbi:Hypothetical predicted protein [Mytilus galloprovincialis]|uniref:Uncharacterized protein n=1 Tax=Mytilus galloprovincialis TaxID=29158 RepID=A0A8B6CVQ8_MYTGA|nr:Hypothetical predicted protein [Mytilus galloprovincialis]
MMHLHGTRHFNMKFTILTFLIVIMVAQAYGTRCSAMHGKCKTRCLSTEIGLTGRGCCHYKKCCYEPIAICTPSCLGICETNGCGCTQCQCECHANCIATNSTTCCSDYISECTDF